MIWVHVLHTGQVSVDCTIPFEHKNPFAKTGWFRKKKYRLSLPVSVYLVEHPKGLLLFDTGWDLETRDTVVNRKCFLPVSYGDLPDGDAVHEHLARLGYTPQDLDYVFLSHLDNDHTGGLPQLKDAKRIMVSEPEWNAAQKWRYFYRYKKRHWKDIDMQTFKYEKTGVGPFGESFDVFGDGTIHLVSTRGHSFGLSTMLISNNDKFVALVGDTGYMQRSWREMKLPGLMVNKQEAIESLQWVQNLSTQDNCLGIYATHDPGVTPCVIEV
ncbi:Quorum-quenching N-acyl-homoserine lactonase [Giardia muris]|uniref:Quorum-quenching N-acyl-homoserine lactonase n=1 Tax=Giardia muris TaxID=5742 RepID=A0A4Z1SR10_GIAMU|nr:Quorum-quenching N-acyl-homoserine lactonase [Giardia muris]|eukprot:TNJ28140.1 Quorum-quenching N-acyl-homoserine lactonase [Giardia muris]